MSLEIDDFDFNAGDAEASYTTNTEAGQLHVGDLICLKKHPCKITSVSTSSTGSNHIIFKHHIIFKFIQYSFMFMLCIIVQGSMVTPRASTSGQSLPFCSLLDVDTSIIREDLQLPSYPSDLAGSILRAHRNGQLVSVTVIAAMGNEKIVSMKKVEDDDTDKPARGGVKGVGSGGIPRRK